MAVDERSRHNLHIKLEQVIGEAEAGTLMEMMPPVGWADVATKRDLDNLAVATKRDLENLAVATKRDLDNLAVLTKRDFDELKLKFEHLAAAIDLKLDAFENKILAAFRSEIRKWSFSMMAFFTAQSGLFLAAIKLLQ